MARIQLDTLVGMGLSNIVAIVILATASATLRHSGVTELTSAAQAAGALRPLAGPFAFLLFTMGIVSTGLMAVPVLASSAAYAVAEVRRWPAGLARPARQAGAFYSAIGIATALGALANILSISPMKALIWSAVLNAMVAVPVMALVMRIASNDHIMGPFAIGAMMRWTGWAATALMAICSVGFLISL